MSAAVLGLSNRLVQLMGTAPASFSHQRSSDGQVFVFGISNVAVLTVLADSSAHPVQIQSVGREIGLGLERLFRTHLNTTPRRYLQELRLHRARILLAETDMPVVDVAIACGYESADNFSKRFRETFGISPRKFSTGQG